MTISDSLSFDSNRPNYKNNGRLVKVNDLIAMPGHTIVKQNVNKIVNYMNNGGLLPPLCVEQDTHIVIDGNHRLCAAIKTDKHRIRAVFL
jgi:hypothetical protein